MSLGRWEEVNYVSMLQYYALSTFYNRSSKGVLHIRIFQEKDGGFGFAEPYNISSITELVLFYSSNPLNRHNPQLPPDLKLEYPYFLENK